jgi:nitrous oxide reductase accessory protein NosL
MVTNLQKRSHIARFSVVSIISSLFILLSVLSLWAMEKDSGIIDHPLMEPKIYTSNMLCPNCGMMINMWARTRHTFTDSEGPHETCSIRCLADMSRKIGEEPHDVKVALYMDPDTMIDADNAFYVVGSSAKGTMTMKSKIAFASEDKAKAYAQENGGEVKIFAEALQMATMEIATTRSVIQNNRMKKEMGR